MGVITDFFLASTTDVARVLTGWQLPLEGNPEVSHARLTRFANSTHIPLRPEAIWSHPPQPNPSANPAPQIDTLPNVQCKGMLPDKLAILFATLTEIPTERALDLILRGFLTGPPETEVTVQRLPSSLTSALANAAHDDLLRAAKVLEEDDIDRWGNAFLGSAKELVDTLNRVQALAKKGVSSEVDLFIWTCT